MTLNFLKLDLEKYLIPCANKSVFGIDCMGCGLQRSIILMFKGAFLEAFFMFPAIYTTVLFFVFVALNFLDKTRNYHKIIVSLAIINAIVMIVSFFIKITNF